MEGMDDPNPYTSPKAGPKTKDGGMSISQRLRAYAAASQASLKGGMVLVAFDAVLDGSLLFS